MSKEKVELIRRVTQIFNVARGGESSLTPLLAPGFRIDNIVTAVTDKTYVGAAGYIEWYNEAVGPDPVELNPAISGRCLT